jgi:hypothetical protein
MAFSFSCSQQVDIEMSPSPLKIQKELQSFQSKLDFVIGVILERFSFSFDDSDLDIPTN